MDVLRGIDARPASRRPTVVTVGKFIVVHRGHRTLFERIGQAASQLDAARAVVTFDRHPLEVLAPSRAPHCVLATLDQRLAMLEEVGVEVVLVLEFNDQIARLEPEEFVQRTLIDALNAKRVIVGQDHRFGHRARGDIPLLQQLGARAGFDVEALPLVHMGEEEVSSTAIRQLVGEGRVDQAAVLMGRPYRLEGVVVEGKRRGKTIGFPTANVQPDAQLCLPAEGVYAGWWVWRGERLPGVIDVGRSPVFGDVEEPKVEIHVFDFDQDLYGQRGEVEFSMWLRGDEDFGGSVDALVAQIRRDAAEARRLLGV